MSAQGLAYVQVSISIRAEKLHGLNAGVSAVKRTPPSTFKTKIFSIEKQ